jgi:hypothetical protein
MHTIVIWFLDYIAYLVCGCTVSYMVGDCENVLASVVLVLGWPLFIWPIIARQLRKVVHHGKTAYDNNQG